MALNDFSDIITAVRYELGIPVGDDTSIAKIKMAINMIYIDEVVPFKRWFWLLGNTKVVHKAYYASGTVSVTPNSTTATLSVAPVVSLGSFKNYYFSVDGFDEVYEISTHTTATTALTLSSAFQGSLNATSSFKIWTDRVALPTDCRETVEVWHNRRKGTMDGRGLQEFRQIVNDQPKAQDFPFYFNVMDYYDPTEGTDETESDRYRIMRVYPSITDQPVTINIDHTKEISALVDDTDEPAMPLEDRVVLVYGALSREWRRLRNEEAATYNQQLFSQKLARMAGKVEDGFDRPKIQVDRRYLSAKRGPRIRGYGRTGMDGFGSSGSYTMPTYLEGVTINGATITGNVTVNTGITIDGRDISADGAALDAHIADTAEHGATGAVMGTTNTQTVTNKSLDDATTNFVDTADETIKIGFDCVGSTSTKTTLTSSQTANRTLTLPDATDTLVGKATTDTLTNKTLAVASNNITSTASKAAVYNGSGNLAASTTDAAQLAVLDDMTAIATVALNDNQSSAADALTWTAASYDSVYVWYSISRGAANREVGLLHLTHDGTNASIAQGAIASVGSSGVTFTADVSGGDLRLRYTSTNTGTAPSLKYKSQRWLA